MSHQNSVFGIQLSALELRSFFVGLVKGLLGKGRYWLIQSGPFFVPGAVLLFERDKSSWQLGPTFAEQSTDDSRKAGHITRRFDCLRLRCRFAVPADCRHYRP